MHEKRRVAQQQIESSVVRMLRDRGLNLKSPLMWHLDSDDVYTVETYVGPHHCHWRLIGEAVENYPSDLNVRYSVDFNLRSYFIP
jgi:hypothetical protein